MATTDLGLVRDKITEVRMISENGTSATYAIMTEMNNTGTGAGTFTVKNGGNIAISEVFSNITDLLNGIKQCGANHIGEIVAIFYQSAGYAWQEVQPTYLFDTADTKKIAQLNGLSLYSVTGNLLTSGNFAFAYYARAEVEESNPKLDGVTLGTYNTLSDLADAVYTAYNSLRTNDKFVGRVGNGAAPEFESTVYTFNFKYRVDANLSYFEYTSAEESGIAKNDNGTWTFYPNETLHYIGAITSALSGMLNECKSYWDNGGKCRICYGYYVSLTSIYYFKEGALSSKVYYEGTNDGKLVVGYAVYENGAWTITPFSEGGTQLYRHDLYVNLVGPNSSPSQIHFETINSNPNSMSITATYNSTYGYFSFTVTADTKEDYLHLTAGRTQNGLTIIANAQDWFTVSGTVRLWVKQITGTEVQIPQPTATTFPFTDVVTPL